MSNELELLRLRKRKVLAMAEPVNGPAQPVDPPSPPARDDYYTQLNNALGPSSPGITGMSNQLVAEAASGANDYIMEGLDVLVKSGNLAAAGYNGVLALLRGENVGDAVNSVDGLPTPSEAVGAGLSAVGIDSRPGDPVMEPSTLQQGARAFGNIMGPGAMGMMPVKGRNITTAGGQAAELMGFGSQSPAQTVSSIVDTADDLARLHGDDAIRSADDFAKRLPSTADDLPAKLPKNPRLARDLALKRGNGDLPAAGFKLDDTGNVVPDSAQKRALKIGIDKSIVAQVAASSPADKTKIGQMLDIVEAGMQNKTHGDYNLPRSILGNSMFDRFNVIRQANKAAGKAVASEVKKLGKMPLDSSAFNQGPLKSFFESLDDLGVSVSRNGKVKFKGSRFEFSGGAKKAIQNTVTRINETDTGSLERVHSLKIMIDDMVESYGKSSSGLTGKADNVLKDLRHNTNQFIRQYSDEYATANDSYAETIDIINTVDRLIGRNNTANKSTLSRTARRALSNAQSSDQVLAVINDMETVAAKHGGVFADDLKTQASVVQTIEKLFPSTKPPASFGGEIDKSLDFAGRQAARGGDALDAVVTGAKKIFGKTDEKRLESYLDSLRELSASEKKTRQQWR